MKAANDNKQIEKDLLVGAKDIANFLGISQRVVYRLTYDGIIPHFKLGGSVAARRSSLSRWMDEQERAAARTMRASA